MRKCKRDLAGHRHQADDHESSQRYLKSTNRKNENDSLYNFNVQTLDALRTKGSQPNRVLEPMASFRQVPGCLSGTVIKCSP